MAITLVSEGVILMRSLVLLAVAFTLGALLGPFVRRVWRFLSALWDIHVNGEIPK